LAKRKAANSRRKPVSPANVPQEDRPAEDEGLSFAGLGRKIDELPPIQAAEHALRRAREEFHRARDHYHALKREAAEGVEHVKAGEVSDLAEQVLEAVRKHPGPGVLVAMVLGFLVGRIGRR